MRLALGLGDQALEQRLRPALDAADDLVVVAQCLAADQLVQAVESAQVDAAVVAWSLHRLTDATLDQIDRSRVALVVLVPDPQDARWSTRRGPVLAVDSEPATVRQAVLAARRGERPASRPRPSPAPITLQAADRAQLPRSPAARVIAVVGGVGSPGRTTVALNLATALGARVPTALVEMDLDGPSLAAYLDLDPSRNMCTLAHAVRETPHAWARALEDELQPLSAACPLGVALCGPPKREMRGSVAPAFAERLIGELARRYGYVVLDVGSDWLGIETPAVVHRVALASAQQVLLVSAASLVGLWHARTAVDHLERHAGLPRERVELVLNGHDPRHHHSPAEVAWHLGVPLAAVVPFDHGAIARAITAQRPVVAEPTSRATRAILALAERIRGDKLGAPGPLDPAPRERSFWRRLGFRSRVAAPDRKQMHAADGLPPPAGVRESGSAAW